MRRDEVEVLLPACIAMFTEEIGVSPLAGDGGALYRARVTELVTQGRAYARIEDGRVLFKAEVGAATSSVCQVQGVWVHPSLRGRGLSVAGTQEEFRDDLDAGQVVYIAEREGGGSWQPGESVTLVVSAGPPLFPVPDIVGLTRDQAKAALTDAGFEYEYATLWDAVLDEITEVESQVPAAGTQHAEGTVVSFRINGAF